MTVFRAYSYLCAQNHTWPGQGTTWATRNRTWIGHVQHAYLPQPHIYYWCFSWAIPCTFLEYTHENMQHLIYTISNYVCAYIWAHCMSAFGAISGSAQGIILALCSGSFLVGRWSVSNKIKARPLACNVFQPIELPLEFWKHYLKMTLSYLDSVVSSHFPTTLFHFFQLD